MSRVREKAERLFEVFLEIAKPNGDEAPFIIQQYPTDYNDKEALMMIPRFAYPCSIEVSQVDHFTFVLTDLESMFRFGYCRQTTGYQTCLCIVSWLPWCEIFYKMLDLLAEITNRSQKNQVIPFLQAAYTHEVPTPTLPVTILADQDMFNFTAPDTNTLPRIPGSRNLTEYYNAIDPNNMMLIFASMLHERRIYMTSKKLSRLTSCIHAAEALLYPMHWQHLYIPVLPSQLIDYISAPMPYLIGVHSNLVEKLKLNRVDVGDAVVVDLDANTVTSEYDDLGDLPEEVSSYLKRNLKPDVIKTSMMKTGDAISMAFLIALVRLIGGYRDALKFRAGEPITFDPEAFVQSRPSMQEFLQGMLTLQIFQQFIYGRLEILNTGGGFKDIFELQATHFADKQNSQSRYKEWLKSVKKSGKKSWNGLKVKVKEQGKKAMSDFKTKFSGLTEYDEKKYPNHQVTGGVIHTKQTKVRPVTTHAGTLPRVNTSNLSSDHSNSDFDKRNKPITRSRSSEDTHDDSQLRLSYHKMDMNLITDNEIQAALQRSASAELLSSKTEDTSDSNGSSDSDNDLVDSNLAFGRLSSSDEDVSVEALNNKTNAALKHPPSHSASPGDKLILSSQRPLQSSEPVAAPRKRRQKSADSASQKSGQAVSTSNSQHQQNSGQDAPPLIKFDSPESEADQDNFDPLASFSSKSSGIGTGRVQASSPSDQNESQKNLLTDIFDPLSELAGISLSGSSVTTSTTKTAVDHGHGHSFRSDPLANRRESADLLMHEWSLASLSRSHNLAQPRTAQPLRMSYPNNPFIAGSSLTQQTKNPGFQSPVRAPAFHSQGNSQQRELYLGHKVSDFLKGNQQPPRQPVKGLNSSSSPVPRQLPSASYAPYSVRTTTPPARFAGSNTPSSLLQSVDPVLQSGLADMTQSSSPTRMFNMINPVPVPGSSASPTHSSHSQHGTPNKSTWPASDSLDGGNSNSSRSQFLSDLLDIDFGTTPESKPQEKEKRQSVKSSTASPLASHPGWETFD